MGLAKTQFDKSDFFLWTKHAKEKIAYYHLSASRVKRTIKYFNRIEYGVAPETIAVMSRAGSKKHPSEIWVMYQIIKSKVNPSVKLRIDGEQSRTINPSTRLRIDGEQSRTINPSVKLRIDGEQSRTINPSVRRRMDKQKTKPSLKKWRTQIKIISAWRYPGISPKGQEIPIPDDIRRELNL